MCTDVLLMLTPLIPVLCLQIANLRLINLLCVNYETHFRVTFRNLHWPAFSSVAIFVREFSMIKIKKKIVIEIVADCSRSEKNRIAFSRIWLLRIKQGVKKTILPSLQKKKRLKET